MAEELKIRLFDSFQIQGDGVNPDILQSHRNAAQIFALLTLSPTQSRDNTWIVEQIWQGTGSRDSLGHEVSWVREALGDINKERLIAKAGQHFLKLDGAEVDVIAFSLAWEHKNADIEALKQAIELYRGPLLKDWIYPWVETIRNEYREKYLRALFWLIEKAMEEEDISEVRAFCRRLYAESVFDTPVLVRLFSTLLKKERYSDAKQFYLEYREAHFEKLGLAPEKQMTLLYEQISHATPPSIPELRQEALELLPPGGAVPPESNFYVRRPADQTFHEALVQRNPIVLLRGPRQAGKSSLLARGLAYARHLGASVVVTDFQTLATEDLETHHSFFLSLAKLIQKKLKVQRSPEECWDPMASPNSNFTDYLSEEVLEKTDQAVVWGIDEADRIFDRHYRSSVFGLFRSWYNARALEEPGCVWKRFTLILTYSTEAHLFIPSLDQSPFNVGTKISLNDFSIKEIAEMNTRCSAPLQSENDIVRLHRLVGGHPFLVHLSLYTMKVQNMSIDELEADAYREYGIFREHLQYLYRTIAQDNELRIALEKLLQGEKGMSSETFSRLRAAGVVIGESTQEVRLRCQLYETYLRHFK